MQHFVVANISIDFAPFIVFEVLLVKCFKIKAYSSTSWYSLNGMHFPNLSGILPLWISALRKKIHEQHSSTISRFNLPKHMNTAIIRSSSNWMRILYKRQALDTPALLTIGCSGSICYVSLQARTIPNSHWSIIRTGSKQETVKWYIELIDGCCVFCKMSNQIAFWLPLAWYIQCPHRGQLFESVGQQGVFREFRDESWKRFHGRLVKELLQMSIPNYVYKVSPSSLWSEWWDTY